MKSITIQIDDRTADALLGLGHTNGVGPNALASAMLIDLTAQATGQGPGEIIEIYVWQAQELEAGRPLSAWKETPNGLARLGRLRRAVKRMNGNLQKGGAR